eukprot:CAMPEP_0177472698 /NCGR_PEP_ID=MMETSP0369-20130122/21452_1 /TAXON_ID=447022 ORGANISM="Scrippsiella hangoei-like, Strain SHHI-4" /NCGR_SAMPLE_ID=MMETSP0369 /ASSEMBLY_ACC=CAM_ASM_000364 /LENGTH=168 /DNA_ID=CAMNT_0018947399 /DNA_START=315 /DNA_END=817 /DNA_ORIENTATION=+
MRFIIDAWGLKLESNSRLMRGSNTFSNSVKSAMLSGFVDATLKTMKECTSENSKTTQKGSINFRVTDQPGRKTISSHKFCGKKVMMLKATLTTAGVGSVFASSIAMSPTSPKAAALTPWPAAGRRFAAEGAGPDPRSVARDDEVPQKAKQLPSAIAAAAATAATLRQR